MRTLEEKGFAMVRFGPRAEDRLGLPDVLHPMPMPIECGLDPETLLRCYQVAAAETQMWMMLELGWQAAVEAWAQRHEIASARLHARRIVLGSKREQWKLTIAPFNPASSHVVGIYRHMTLIGAIRDAGDGTLQVFAYRPLDDRALWLIDEHAKVSEGWAGLRSYVIGQPEADASDRRWSCGIEEELGTHPNHLDPHAAPFGGGKRHKPRPPAELVAQLGAYDAWRDRMPRLKLIGL